MAFSTWEMQAGNPAIFAFKIALLPNPDGDADRAAPEESASWGSFTVWARGENLCSHVEQGEVIDASHWYMLPVMEWFAENWDAVFHEERLPLRNSGRSAAEAMRRTKVPPLSLKEIDEFDWLDVWAAWWSRHSLRSGREGGLFPDLYMRRSRERLEVSTGAEPLMGIPVENIFLAPNRSYEIDLSLVAEPLFDVLTAMARELSRRIPESSRVARLAAALDGLKSPDRRLFRLAWLAGCGDRISAYEAVADAVDRALIDTPTAVREQLTGALQATDLVISGSAYANLLYGAVSPTTTLEDVTKMTSKLVDNFVDNASTWLERLDLPLGAAELVQLSPGEQGSHLGERACALLFDRSEAWIDITKVLAELQISVTGIDLTDEDLRAVSVFGPTQRPHIFCNRRFRWANRPGVDRFTLAHELCHLLLDRDFGDELAVASGPWAPLAIEQRANAFAAGFLMPTWLLKNVISSLNVPLEKPEAISAVASTLRVSVSSLVDRLYNLGELTFDERIRLREVYP